MALSVQMAIAQVNVQRDYVMIHVDEKTLSLPLDPDYTTEEYTKVFQGFFTSISDAVVDEPNKETKENNG